MRKQIKLILYALPLLAAAGCDTKEDVFVVGSVPQETQFLNIDKSQVTFSPEGGTYEIKVTSIASWQVTLTNNNSGQFSVTPTSGKGDGVITVTAKENPSKNSFEAEVQLSPLNFEMKPVTVALTQTNTTFSIDTYPSSDATPEEGGSVTMTAYSSIAWELEVIAHDADNNIGDIDWLTITPGISGEGKESNTPQEFRFTWKPNYTKSDRTIRLQLKPSGNMNLNDLPRPFTLVQTAGTDPQSVRCVVDNLDIVNADVTFEYSSRSPIKDCGVILYKVGENGLDSITTYRPNNGSGEYAKNGNYKLSMPELTENTNFRLVPYTVNEVGKSEGDPREITTGIKPENMVYQGVAIVNPSSGGITIDTDIVSATLTMTVTSDVTPLENRIASAVMNFNGTSVNGVASPNGDSSWIYVFKTADAGGDLISNKEYEYTIVITGADLPRSQGQVVNKVATYTGKFKTQGLTPGDDDNSKPTVGN